MKKILSLYDSSGEWCKPYVNAGYEVLRYDFSCGLDVRLIQKIENVHGILAAPPCTHLSNAGSMFWVAKGDQALLSSLSTVDAVFRIVYACNPQWWCLENPVGRLSKFIGKPKLIFQPFEFGDPYYKRTCLWGNFNSNLYRNPVEPKFRMMGGSKTDPNYHLPEIRTKGQSAIRSKTPQGFAEAFFNANP